MFFLHIPKTGGTTFVQSCRKNFEKGEIIYGHNHYRSDLPKGCKIATVLRDPLQRWVSNLNYSISSRPSQKSPNYLRLFFDSSKNLNQILQRCLNEEVNVNTMTKMLAGIPTDYRPGACKTEKFSDKDMKQIFDTAKIHLMQIDFVGFIEHLDYFFKSVTSSLLGDSIKLGTKARVNKQKKIQEQDLDAMLLYRLNEYDIKLYKFALKQFPQEHGGDLKG